ncbi:alpha-L-fucosidase [Pedobacter sp. BS3]|uniref:alpha-L-fucosidase n=1 Tax=Pedobacter sp. BS3 TaxID=2567937 RepID=UPI0011ECAEBB|nr:alpha-L-fucosidase [Pedobacter sp. BS3]TZF82590.1 alpha-L-fucosidase [Pedobacter sp. BS3]
MKILKILLSLLLVASVVVAQQVNALPGRMQWWQNAKFGMFIHWGLYSQAAGEWNGKPSRGNEHFMLYERIPVKEYAKIADDFNPVKFNADLWVKRAKDAGMKYIVFTSKHHDGYAMYNSKSSDYNVVKTTKWGRDPLKELAAACKKYGLKLGIYYSLGRDWEDPDVPTDWPTKGGRSNTWDFPDEDAKDFSKYFERKVKPQVTELLTNYGPVGVMWFDTPEGFITKSQSVELENLIRKLQPDCIINNRIGNGEGDYFVSEQKIPANAVLKPWEACITMSGKWSFNKYDHAWKSPELIIRQLIEIVCKGGNLLLNVNPDGQGEFPAKSIDNLEAIHQWMNSNKEAIYGVTPWKITNEGIQTEQGAKNNPNAIKDTDNDNTSKQISPDLYFSQKGDVVYLYARSWKAGKIEAKSLSTKNINIKRVELLNRSNNKLSWKQDANSLLIDVPKQLPGNLPIYVFKVISK